VRNIVVAALLAALLAMSSRADAYLCTAVPSSNPQLSQAWNQRCIPYFISNAGALLDGEFRRQLILQSFRVWTAEACTDLMFMDFGYTDQAPGFDPRRNDNKNIVVSVEDPLDARELFTRNELAITITSFNTATGEIFDADIMINAANFAFEDLTSTDECHSQSEPPYDLRNTLVHEIGHFIGFEHDPDPASTMFASAPECETKKRDLTQDNKLGVCTVYATGQPTMTCAPPDTYDKGPGDPDDFRNQCDVEELRSSCGCTTADGSDRSAPWLLALIGLWVWRRRATGR
jgi:MYXO-CTERM domain-containing protein